MAQTKYKIESKKQRPSVNHGGDHQWRREWVWQVEHVLRMNVSGWDSRNIFLPMIMGKHLSYRQLGAFILLSVGKELLFKILTSGNKNSNDANIYAITFRKKNRIGSIVEFPFWDIPGRKIPGFRKIRDFPIPGILFLKSRKSRDTRNKKSVLLQAY